MARHLRRLFEIFHRHNPEVYKKFKHYAFEALGHKRPRYSAYMIWQRMRWYMQFEQTDKTYKINDHHVAYYSRLFMDDHPQFGKFFELRRLRGGGEERMDPGDAPDPNAPVPGNDTPKQGWLI